MDRFAPDVWRLESGGRIVLFHGRTGRSFAIAAEVLAEIERWVPGLPAPPDLEAVARRLDGLRLLVESPPLDLGALIAAPSRMPILLPELPALWLPLPAVRTPGGHGWAERRLSPMELAAWRAINGARSLRAVAEKAGIPLSDLLAFSAELTHPEVQALQLRERPVGPHDPGLGRLVAPERPPAHRPAHLRGPKGETTLAHYHQLEITHGDTHFDDRETTVAHAFAVPHPALEGQPFGQRLVGALEARGHWPEGAATLLEIGPGDGELGADLRVAADARGLLPRTHIRLDQSPELLRTSARRQPGTRGILGNATELPMGEASVDLVICNEVLADLSAVPFDPMDPFPEGAAEEVAARIERYGIAPLPGEALYNLGAWKLIEELARVLAPGGAAYLSEFGGMEEIPVETVHLDHPEVSIHFGHLQTIARRLGLEARVLPMAELLGFDLTSTWLSRHSYEGLRARMHARGEHLAARAWTPATLKLPFKAEGLDWVPISHPGAAPVVTRFQALLLRR